MPARYLFVCIQNAGRSQMAAAWARSMGHTARSAGSRPAERIHPPVASTMQEAGISLSGASPARLTDEDVAWADVVVTMGCGDVCPVLPGTTYIEWDIADPAGMDEEGVRRIRDELKAQVANLVEQHS